MKPNDQLRNQLEATAMTIETGDAVSALDVARSKAGRRKRLYVLGGLAGSFALIAGGLVAVGTFSNQGGSNSLSIAGPPETEAPAPTDNAASDSTDDSDSIDSETDAPAPVDEAPTSSNSGASVETIEAEASVHEGGIPGASEDGYIEWFVPWQDGFLAAERTFTPQALPDTLPEDVVALFPQEVIDFFDGELPPTISEATEMLTEAGLLDEVTAVLAEHPEANEAIYAIPQPAATFDVYFTADGSEWEPIDFQLPEGVGDIQQMQSTGDRLVTMSQTFQSLSPRPGPFSVPPEAASTSVISTTDLMTWDVVEVPVGQRPDGLPEIMSYNVYPQSLATNDNGWVVTLSEQTEVRFDEAIKLLPQDLQDQFNDESGNGYGMGQSEDGIEISLSAPLERYDEEDAPPITAAEPEPLVEVTLTWEELGIPAEFVPNYRSVPGATLWAAPWGGIPSKGDGADTHSVFGAADGFYSIGETLRYSPDGVAWTTVDGPFQRAARSLLAVGTGVVVLSSDSDGTDLYRVEGSTGTWEQLDVPELPTHLQQNFGRFPGDQAAMVFDAAEPFVHEPYTIVVEHDGFVLSLDNDGPKTSIEIVDSAGVVVLDEAWHWEEQEDAPSYVSDTPDGAEFRDPETDEVIVVVPQAVMEQAYQTQGPSYDYENDYQQDLWLMASVDGERWLIDDLADPPNLDESRRYFAPRVAVSGTTLLMSLNGEWTSYDLS